MANYTLDLTGDQVNAALKEVHNNTVVKKTAQTFTDAEKSQIRENIGAGSGADVAAISEKIGNSPLPTVAQTLTGAIDELHEQAVQPITQHFELDAQRQIQANIGLLLQDGSLIYNYFIHLDNGHLCLSFISRE